MIVSGPPGFPVLKVTNSRSSFGKIPKIPVVKLMTYLHANTFIIARKWPISLHIRCMLFWGYRSFFIRFRCPKYRSRLFRILSTIPILIFSLLNIFLFLILSLLVTPSIFRRHAISNTLSLCFCFSFIVHVSALYTVGCSTPVGYLVYLRVLWPCSVPWSSIHSPAPAKFPSPTQFSFPYPCQTPLVC